MQGYVDHPVIEDALVLVSSEDNQDGMRVSHYLNRQGRAITLVTSIDWDGKEFDATLSFDEDAEFYDRPDDEVDADLMRISECLVDLWAELPF